MNHQDFSALAFSRRSVRDFRPEPVDQAILDAIFDDARSAPSWSNTRPYMLAIASGDRLERLCKAYLREFDRSLPLQHKKSGSLFNPTLLKMFFTRALPDGDFKTYKPYPKQLRERSVANGVALYKHLGIARGDLQGRDAHNRRNFYAFGAPVLGFLFVHRELLPFSAHDGGLMLQTLFLSAKAHGVDSCPLGVMATWRRPVDEEFEVPKDYALLTGFALGYASGAHVNEFCAKRPALNFIPPKDNRG